MPKTKSEKIAYIEEQITQLENQRKKIVAEQKAQERNARTKRLCKRAGLLECLLPETITLTDEQFEIFLKKTVANDFGRDKLREIISQNSEKPAPKATETAGNTNTPPPLKPANTAQNGGTGGNANEGDNERRDG